MAGFTAYAAMRRKVYLAAAVSVFLLSTACGDTSVGEALPHDVVVQVCEDIGVRGVLLSELGVSEAYSRADEILGTTDGLDSWALFLGYPHDICTFTQCGVENCLCREFGVIRLSDLSTDSVDYYLSRLSERIGDGGCVEVCGRFIAYSVGCDCPVNAAIERLYCAD